MSIKTILWLITGMNLLVLLVSPITGSVMLSFLFMGAMGWGLAHRVWTVTAQDRHGFARALSRSVTEGPVSGGLIPFLAAPCLMALIVFGAWGG